MNRRTTRSHLLAASIGALVALAGCSESSVPPTQALDSAPDRAVNAALGDEAVTVFTYDYRAGTTASFGPHKIVMPAFSVCEPLLSSYGTGTWDQACPLASHDIVITARTWTGADGHAHVDFTPSLRFAPTDDSKRFVKLFFKDKDATDETLAAQLNILWVPFPGAKPVDEYASDASLRTQASTGMIWRRVKHFSGYMVASGRTEMMVDDTSLGGM